MDTLDANLIKKLNYQQITFPIIHPKILIDSTHMWSNTPRWYLGYNFLEDIDPLLISVSLDRLKRLGLIDLSDTSMLLDKSLYLPIEKEDNYIKECLSKALQHYHDVRYKPAYASGIFTDYGITFVQTCVDD